MSRIVIVGLLGMAAGAWAGQVPTGQVPGGLPSKRLPQPLVSPLPPLTKPHPGIAALRGYVALIRTNAGNVTVELDADAAPNTVRNFIKLAERGFYDGQRFYCVFKDTMVLCGDPKGTGTSDVGYTIPFEPSPLPHLPGTVAMDRLPPGPSSGSRFFINLKDQAHLDRDYAVFGRITDGTEVAQRIGETTANPNNGSPAPIEDVVIEDIQIKKKEATSKKEPPKTKKAEEESQE
jgi:peptidyl-prolyl cis-trans isomerase B (cyclophilin B)